MNPDTIFPRQNDPQTVYLKNVVTDPAIEVGDYTFYNDFEHNPCEFERNNVLYHYPINPERLVIGRYCSIGCGAKFMFTSGNHAARSAASFPFPIFYDEWGMGWQQITRAWDNKGDIVIGNDVWIGYGAVIMQGVHIGDGAVVGTRAVVTHDVEPYSIVGGTPARKLKMRFDAPTVERLMRLQWWNWPDEKVARNIENIVAGNIDALEQA